MTVRQFHAAIFKHASAVFLRRSFHRKLIPVYASIGVAAARGAAGLEVGKNKRELTPPQPLLLSVEKRRVRAEHGGGLHLLEPGCGRGA